MRKTLSQENKELLSCIEDISKENIELKAEKHSLKNEVYELGKSIESLNHNRMIISALADEKSKEADNLRGIVKDLNTTLSECKKVIDDSRIIISSLKAEKNALKISRDDYSRRLDDLRSRFKSLEENDLMTRSKLKTAHKYIERNKEIVNSAPKTIEVLTNKIGQLEFEIESDKKFLENRNALYIEALEKVKSLERSNSEYDQILKIQVERKTSLKMDLDRLRLDIWNKDLKIDELIKKLEFVRGNPIKTIFKDKSFFMTIH